MSEKTNKDFLTSSEFKERLDLKLDGRKKLSGTKNFRFWFKLIEQTLKNAGFENYLNDNIIEKLKKDKTINKKK